MRCARWPRRLARARCEPGCDRRRDDLRAPLLSGNPRPRSLIRTAGELRLSNFLLWETAYSEIYVTPTCWPDFDRDHLIAALADYQKRVRRFGAVVVDSSETY